MKKSFKKFLTILAINIAISLILIYLLRNYDTSMLTITFLTVMIDIFIYFIKYSFDMALYLLAKKNVNLMYKMNVELYEEIIEYRRLRYESYFLEDEKTRDKNVNIFTLAIKLKGEIFLKRTEDFLENEGCRMFTSEEKVEKLKEMIVMTKKFLEAENSN